MYRIAICEIRTDCGRFLELLAHEVLNEADIEHNITRFGAPGELKQTLKRNPVAFDIIITGRNPKDPMSIDYPEFLRNNSNEVSLIIVSDAFEEFSERYSVYPVYLLPKPVQKQRLGRLLRQDYNRSRVPQSVLFPIKGGTRSEPLEEILYAAIYNREISVHTKKNSFITRCPTLKSVAGLAPHGMFLQCHKSFMVCTKNIKEIGRTGILLVNGEEISVGRSYYSDVRSAFTGCREKITV